MAALPSPLAISTDMSMGIVAGQCNGLHPRPADVDDAYAVALALAAPELDVRGLSVTFGNGALVPEMVGTERMLDALGASVAVAAGSAAHLPPVATRTFDGHTYPTHDAGSDGVRLLADAAMAVEGLRLLTMGPLTDVATLVLREPAAAARIAEVVVLMGRMAGTVVEINDVALPDFNFTVDPRAAEVVFAESAIPITVIPFDVSRQGLVPIETVRAFAQSDDPAQRHFGQASMPWTEGWHETFGEPGFHPWDAHTVWAVMHPEAYVWEEASFRLSGGPPSCGPGTGLDLELVAADESVSRTVRVARGMVSRDGPSELVEAIVDAVVRSG